MGSSISGDKKKKQEEMERQESAQLHLAKYQEQASQWKKNEELLLKGNGNSSRNTNFRVIDSGICETVIGGSGPPVLMMSESEVMKVSKHCLTEANADGFSPQQNRQFKQQSSIPENLGLEIQQNNQIEQNKGSGLKQQNQQQQFKLNLDQIESQRSYYPENQNQVKNSNFEALILEKNPQEKCQTQFSQQDETPTLLQENQSINNSLKNSVQQQQFDPRPLQENQKYMFGTYMPGVAPDHKQQETDTNIHQIPMQQNLLFQPVPITQQNLLFQPVTIIQYYPDWLKQMLQIFGDYQPSPTDLIYQDIEFKTEIQLNNQYIYEGYLCQNQKHGFGMLLLENEFYEGYFFKDQKQGYGRILIKGGCMKSGLWQNGQIVAELKYRTQKSWYEGECQNSIPHGKGIFEDDLSRYEGMSYNGQKNGQGTLYMKKEGSRYEGSFLQDRMHGYGKYFFKSGKTHYGEYQNNKMNGKGLMQWPDGRSYDGNFVNGFKHGQGIYKDIDGSVYNGSWFEDMKEGYGALTTKGIQIVGQWKQNEFQE